MFNSYTIGFICAATAALAGVDYLDQSGKAGLALGQMPIGDYARTIPDRFSEAKADKLAEVAERDRQKRWKKGGLPYLPDAPAGWSRRSLTEGDNAAVMPFVETDGQGGAGGSFLEQMKAREAAKEEIERATRSWVYERGDEAVFVEIATREDTGSNSLAGLVATTIRGMGIAETDRRTGYAVIGGVGFTETLDKDGQRKHHFRVLDGTIGFGQEIGIRVHANASSGATREILAAIDYDGLNALLAAPLATVGNAARVPDTLDEVQLALEMWNLRREFEALRALEAQYRIDSIDGAALIVNTYAQAYGGLDGAVDLTAGKAPDMNGLIAAGYRTALAALMQGKSPEEISHAVAEVVHNAVAAAEQAAAIRDADADQGAPSMSPGLARELGLVQDSDAEPASGSAAESAAQTGAAQPGSGDQDGVGWLSSLLNRVGASDQQVDAEPVLPQRLKLANEGQQGTARCVGSFCD